MLLDIVVIVLIYLLIKRFVFNKSIGNFKVGTLQLALIEVLLVIVGLAGVWIGFTGAFKEVSEIIPELALILGVLCLVFSSHVATRLHKVSAE